MAKLAEREIDFLRLLLRSPDNGDGWRYVSKVLWTLVEKFGRPELIEAIPTEDGSGHVRLTERGLIVCDYI